MRRLLLVLVTGIAAMGALLAPASASAHPLGNFTVNHFAAIDLAGNAIYVRYALDLAEIPTFQEGADVRRPAFAAALARKLELEVDGRRVPLGVVSHRTSERPGAGGLKTMRFDAVFRAATTGSSLVFTDSAYASRIGWREIVVNARDGAAVTRSSAPPPVVRTSFGPTRTASCGSPLDVRTASVSYQPGTVEAAAPEIGAAPAAVHASGGFESLIRRGDLSFGVILISLLIAAFWGSVHALTPGHGKALVAGYLVGTKGKPRHAFLLGATVTVTHTAGVFALGLVTLLLSQFIVPDQLYPWLTLASGLLVVLVGASVLRQRLRTGSWASHAHGDGGHADGDHHGHGDHDHGHDHATTTATPPPSPRRVADLAGHPRRRRRGRPPAVPVGARRAPLGDRDPSDRLRLRADRRVQPRPRRHDHVHRPPRRARASCVRPRLARGPSRPRAARVERACDSLRRRCPDRQGPAGRDLNRSGKEGEYPPCSVSTTRSPISRPGARSSS